MDTVITVQHNQEAPTYDAVLGGEVVGTVMYELQGSRAVISHTIVDPAHRGRGIAAQLVRGTLDDLRRRNLRVTNYCSYVSAFVSDHPEYRDLIDPNEPGMA